jgi:hypothetical protein
MRLALLLDISKLDLLSETILTALKRWTEVLSFGEGLTSLGSLR